MSFVSYVLRRIVLIPVLLFALFTFIFILSHVVPGDPVRAMAGEGATPEQIATLEQRYGLDKPLWTQYFAYLSKLVHGDMGISIYTWRPVLDDLKDYFPATVELTLVSMIIALVIGVTLGTVSAVRSGGLLDSGITMVSLVGVTMPQFWLGMMLQMGLCVYLVRWFPLGGRIAWQAFLQPITGLYIVDSVLTGNWAALASTLHHMILPAVTLSFLAVGVYTRITRTALLEVLRQDFMTTARAVGLPEHRVVGKALRNAFLPIVTMLGIQFGFLLGGAVVVEAIFDWPGVGLYAAQAALSSDYPAIMGVTLLFGIVRMSVNLVSDLSYFLADPRIRET